MKAQALLLYVVWESRQEKAVVPKEKLTDFLWPGMPASSALQNLRQTLYQIRKVLPTEEMLEVDRKTVALKDPSMVRTDVDPFLSAAALAGVLSIEQMEQLVASWGGLFLDNFSVPACEAFDEWVDICRSYLSNLYVGCLERLIIHYQGKNQPKKTGEYAQKWVEIDPLSEKAQTAWIQTLTRQGKRNKALQAFEQYKALLKEELNIPPGESLTSYVDEIREGRSFPVNRQAGKKRFRQLGIVSAISLVVLLLMVLVSTWKETKLEAPLRMAILPFENYTAREYLADGLTDDIISKLSKVEGLQMISRQSSVQFKNSTRNPSEIGVLLDVSYLIKGSIQEADASFKVNLECFDTQSGEIKWAESFTRSAEEIFSFQEAIAEEVVKNLQGTFNLASDERRLPKSDAYDAYLKGRFAFYQAEPEGLEEAAIQFNKAIEIDPDFLEARAALAWTYCTMGGSWGDKRIEDVFPLAQKQLRLIKDDPSMKAFYHRTMGWVHFWSFDKEEGIRQLRIGVQYDPNVEFGLSGLAMMLAVNREFEEAKQVARKGLATNPHFFWNHFVLSMAHYYDGQFDEALASSSEAISLYDGHMASLSIKARSLFQLGKAKESVDFIQEQLQRLGNRPPLFLADLARAYLVLGDTAHAKLLLDELVNGQENGEKYYAYFAATLYAGIGEEEAALPMLQAAYEEGDVELNWMEVDFPFENMRDSIPLTISSLGE